MSCEVWIKNEGLPIRDSLYELYTWFYKKEEWLKAYLRDLEILGEHMSSLREERFYNERKRRANK